MSILSANRLHQLIDQNIITALHENVNAASIDIRIGNKILVEEPAEGHSVGIGLYNQVHQKPVDVDAKQSPKFVEVEIPEEGIVIEPGEAFLASTIEYFNLPDTISAQFKLRSSLGRCFLEHMAAGWCDAGWHGAQLTMEFVNLNRYHRLLIKPGMRVGQMIFFEHEHVGDESYSIKGNYNNQEGPTKAFEGQDKAY